MGKNISHRSIMQPAKLHLQLAEVGQIQNSEKHAWHELVNLTSAALSNEFNQIWLRC